MGYITSTSSQTRYVGAHAPRMVHWEKVMLTGKNVFKALVVSAVLAMLLSFGSVVIFGAGVSVDPALDWEKINSMPYSEATSYISAHTTRTTPWESLKTHIRWLAFITPQFFALIGALFAGCISLLLWTRK